MTFSVFEGGRYYKWYYIIFCNESDEGLLMKKNYGKSKKANRKINI